MSRRLTLPVRFLDAYQPRLSWWAVIKVMSWKYALGMLAVWGIVAILGVSVGFWGIAGITALLYAIAGMADA